MVWRPLVATCSGSFWQIAATVCMQVCMGTNFNLVQVVRSTLLGAMWRFSGGPPVSVPGDPLSQVFMCQSKSKFFNLNLNYNSFRGGIRNFKSHCLTWSGTLQPRPRLGKKIDFFEKNLSSQNIPRNMQDAHRSHQGHSRVIPSDTRRSPAVFKK